MKRYVQKSRDTRSPLPVEMEVAAVAAGAEGLGAGESQVLQAAVSDIVDLDQVFTHS